MGAYFQTHVTNNKTGETLILDPGFCKFLEYAYINDPAMAVIHKTICSHGSCRVATVASYDESDNYQNVGATVKWHPFSNDYTDATFINHEKKQFINYESIIKRAKNEGIQLDWHRDGDNNNFDHLLDPLSLLTRKHPRSIGGGDLCFDLETLKPETIKYCSTWYGDVIEEGRGFEPIRVDSIGYEDLSPFFFLPRKEVFK